MAGKQKKQSRKMGRNKLACERYRLENRREKAKLRKLTKVVAWNPNDTNAQQALEKYRLAVSAANYTKTLRGREAA